MNTARGGEKFVGGKSCAGTYHRIINEIPPHRVLIEPFAGEATIARIMRPPREIILVDKVRQPGLQLAAPDRTRFVLGDGISFCDSYRYKGDEIIYADPPYLLAARLDRGREYYAHELPDAEHRRFLRVMLGVNCRVMVSGYHSPMYDDALADWRRIEFTVGTRGGGTALEVLWMNYPQPTTLHDWRFVGDNFRVRCRLRRKIKRAVADLASMPALERGAMFDALRCAMATPAGSAESDAAGLSAARVGTGAPAGRLALQ